MNTGTIDGSSETAGRSPPDFEAEIIFVPTAHGGRHGPARSGYRPAHDFGLPGNLNSAAHEYLGQEWVEPGTSARANLRISLASHFTGRLYPGMTFTIHEGSRVVGHGVIIEVLNKSLLRPTP